VNDKFALKTPSPLEDEVKEKCRFVIRPGPGNRGGKDIVLKETVIKK